MKDKHGVELEKCNFYSLNHAGFTYILYLFSFIEPKNGDYFHAEVIMSRCERDGISEPTVKTQQIYGRLKNLKHSTDIELAYMKVFQKDEIFIGELAKRKFKLL